MVYSTQNYWVFRLCISSGILKVRKHNFRKLDLFLSSGEEGKTPTQLGPLERANLNQWSSEVGYDSVDWINLAQNGNHCQALMKTIFPYWAENFLTTLATICLLKTDSAPWR
jgi:hypothetical protein